MNNSRNYADSNETRCFVYGGFWLCMYVTVCTRIRNMHASMETSKWL